MRKHVTITLAALLTVFAGWAHAQEAVTSAPKSLRGIDVPGVDAPPAAISAPVGKKPGLQKPIARTFMKQPPLIPHALTNFDEITMDENQCMSCHSPEKYKEKRAPKIGDSHFMDREGNKHANVSMLRYNCTQCHVPQTDAPPLVENTFKGVVDPVTKK